MKLANLQLNEGFWSKIKDYYGDIKAGQKLALDIDNCMRNCSTEMRKKLFDTLPPNFQKHARVSIQDAGIFVVPERTKRGADNKAQELMQFFTSLSQKSA